MTEEEEAHGRTSHGFGGGSKAQGGQALYDEGDWRCGDELAMALVHAGACPVGLRHCLGCQVGVAAFLVGLALLFEPLGKYVMVVQSADELLQFFPRSAGLRFIVADLVEDLDCVAHASCLAPQTMQELGVEASANGQESFVQCLAITLHQSAEAFIGNSSRRAATGDQDSKVVP
jgi:hypothetical protein